MYKSITFSLERYLKIENSFCLSFTFSEVKPKSSGSKGQTQIHW